MASTSKIFKNIQQFSEKLMNSELISSYIHLTWPRTLNFLQVLCDFSYTNENKCQYNLDFDSGYIKLLPRYRKV